MGTQGTKYVLLFTSGPHVWRHQSLEWTGTMPWVINTQQVPDLLIFWIKPQIFREVRAGPLICNSCRFLAWNSFYCATDKSMTSAWQWAKQIKFLTLTITYHNDFRFNEWYSDLWWLIMIYWFIIIYNLINNQTILFLNFSHFLDGSASKEELVEEFLECFSAGPLSQRITYSVCNYFSLNHRGSTSPTDIT